MAASSTTPLEVCNLALLYVGNGQTINSFDEATQESRACKVYYAKARDALLQRFHWSFATKRSVLAESTETRTGWAYVYVLPADYLAARRIWAGTRAPNAQDKIPFAVEGALLLTDEAAAELIYTFQEDTVAKWSPLFVEALAWDLAVKLCLILPVKPEWANAARVGARAAYLEAGAADHRASQPDVNPPSEYTSAR